MGRTFPAAVPLVGDLRAITRELRRQLEGEPYTGQRQARVAEWRRQADAEIAQLGQELPEIRYLDILRNLLPRDSALVIDNTQLGYWAEDFYPAYQPHGVITATGSA